MSSSRIFVGRLPYRATDRDVEKLFRGYGKVRDVMLKRGYGFVELTEARDADDAVRELDGTDMMGMKITVELARGTPHGRDRGGGDEAAEYRGGNNRPQRTEYRLVVENLSSRVSWQDLKDFFRPAAEASYAEAHTQRKNEGIIEFASKADMDDALDKVDGKELNGRKIRLRVDKKRSRSRSRSPNESKRSKRSRSPSGSASPARDRRDSKADRGSNDTGTAH